MEKKTVQDTYDIFNDKVGFKISTGFPFLINLSFLTDRLMSPFSLWHFSRKCSVICHTPRADHANNEGCKFILLYKKVKKFLFLKIMDKYEAKVLRIHLGPRVNAIIASPEGFEKVLSSNKQITKVRYLSFSDWGVQPRWLSGRLVHLDVEDCSEELLSQPSYAIKNSIMA